MRRGDAILAILASAAGRALTPAQLQKAAFLVARNIPGVVDVGPAFEFMPYDYGPFDKSVYAEAAALEQNGLATISQSPSGRWNVYSASDQGIEVGGHILTGLPEQWRKYINEATAWVRRQSFTSLVKSIYQQYPDMKVNSIFRD